MAITPPSELTAIRDRSLEIAATASVLKINRHLKRVDTKNFEASWALVAPFIAQGIVSAQASAALVSQWYLEQAVSSTVPRLTTVSQAATVVGVTSSGMPVARYVARTPEVVAARVAGGMDVESAFAMSARQLVGVTMTEPWRISREMTAEVALTDPNYAGWRRVPESGACSFCRMLSTRGSAYYSQESATRSANGLKYHARCRCTAEPVIASDAAMVNKAAKASWADSPMRRNRPARTKAGGLSLTEFEKASQLRLPGMKTPERLSFLKLQLGNYEGQLAKLLDRAGDPSVVKPIQWTRSQIQATLDELALF